jgi:hypothetical protein
MNLLKVVEMAAARHIGVTLADIVQEFGCDYRTAQRMIHVLEQSFMGVESYTDHEQGMHGCWACAMHAS